MDDHITEAYLGKMSKRMETKSKERINWIKEHIVGDNVLDIGCSQGILEVLTSPFANILGMDVDPDSIAYARRFIAEQPEELQGKIRIECHDFLEYDFGDEKFTTIVLGEVLEHLYDPESFLLKAKTLLADNGKIIVTVPFGINRHPDHKKTYYLSDIYKLFSNSLLIENVDYIGDCICVQAKKELHERSINLDTAFIDEEKAMYEKEESYLSRIEGFKSNAERTTAIKDELISSYKKELTESREKIKKINHTLLVTRKDRDKKSEELDYIKGMRSVRAILKVRRLLSKVKELSSKKLDNSGELLSRDEFYKESDKKFLGTVLEMVEEIPESNGGRFYIPFNNVKIAIIADEFLMDAWKGAARFLYVTPDNWESIAHEADILIVVSSWRGLDNVWRGMANDGSVEQRTVFEVIDAFKARSKTTVFYSKEDPPNYSIFLPYAQKCDYIFTTCEEVIEDYKRDCNNDNVNVLEFCINPLFHNPIGMKNKYRKNEVLFSGSWMKKYPNRQTALQMLFDGVLESSMPLHIIDRNYDIISDSYMFPRRFWKYISPAVDHEVLQKIHKLFEWAININSITDSKTMFANRSYELLANGNLLLSNYSLGVHEKLPLIYTVTSKEEILNLLKTMTPEDAYIRQIAGIRSVMTGETCFDRVSRLLNIVGIKTTVNERKVLVIVDTITDCNKESFEKQTYPNRAIVELKNLNEDVYNAFDVFTFFDDACVYQSTYLEDMMNAFKYTDVSFVTKDSYYEGDKLIEGVEHDFVDSFRDKNRTVFWCTDYEFKDVLSNKLSDVKFGYSIDHFNYQSMPIDLS